MHRKLWPHCRSNYWLTQPLKGSKWYERAKPCQRQRLLVAGYFSGLMVLAFFIYAILDGYDLGVGILLPMQHEPQRDIMIASIGPFGMRTKPGWCSG